MLQQVTTTRRRTTRTTTNLYVSSDMPNKKAANYLDSPPRTSLLIWCLAVICTVATLAVIVAGIVVFIGYLVIRPTAPFVKVTYARLEKFDFDQTGLLTTKLTIVINAENRNQKAYGSFSDFKFMLKFNNINVAVLKVPKAFDVTTNNSLPLNFPVEATPIPLNPYQMTFASSSLVNDIIPFELNGHTRVRWHVGPLGSTRSPFNMQCQLQFRREGTCVYSRCTSKSKQPYK